MARMIRSGLVSVTFRQLTPEAVVELVRQAGLHGIEWGGDVHAPHGNLRRAREVRELTMAAGVAVAAYGSYYRAGSDGNGGPEWQPVLETARELGAPLIRVWAGREGSANADVATRHRVADDLRRIAEDAVREGIRVAAEFHGGTLTDTNTSAAQLIAEVGHVNFHAYWQPLIGMSDKECLAGLRSLAPRLAHLHVYQWLTAKDRRPLAEGAARWRQFLDAAAAAPGDRYAMIEFVRDDDPESFLQDAATLREWLHEG